jgi:hypothetical protein
MVWAQQAAKLELVKIVYSTTVLLLLGTDILPYLH